MPEETRFSAIGKLLAHSAVLSVGLGATAYAASLTSQPQSAAQFLQIAGVSLSPSLLNAAGTVFTNLGSNWLSDSLPRIFRRNRRLRDLLADNELQSACGLAVGEILDQARDVLPRNYLGIDLRHDKAGVERLAIAAKERWGALAPAGDEFFDPMDAINAVKTLQEGGMPVNPVTVEEWTDLLLRLKDIGSVNGIQKRKTYEYLGVLLSQKYPSAFLRVITDSNHEATFKRILIGSLGSGLEEIHRTLRRIEDIGAPPLWIPTLDRDMQVGESGWLLYARSVIPFIGRERELEELQRFALDPEPGLRWWRLAGPAGSGKSRLAQSLSIWASASDWKVGFLERAGDRDRWDWLNWNPENPTLLIIDYALDRLKTTLGALQTLATAKTQVRVLLIARESEGLLWQHFDSKLTGALGAAIKDKRYRADALRLDLIDDQSLEETWNWVLQGASNSSGTKKSSMEWREVRPRLESEGLLQPLWIALSAAAIAQGKILTEWSRDEILTNILLAEVNRWAHAGIDDPRYANMVALSSILGGFSYDEDLPHDLLPSEPRADRCATTCAIGRGFVTEQEREFFIPALEPDVLAEAYVLFRQKEDLWVPDAEDGRQASKATRQLLDWTWRNRRDRARNFNVRCVQDFGVRFEPPENARNENLSQLPFLLDEYTRNGDGNETYEILRGWGKEASLFLEGEDRVLWCMALYNVVTNSEFDYDKADKALDEIRILEKRISDEPAVREWLAKALFNAFTNSEVGGERAEGLLGELRRLSGEHPDEPAVREPLTKALANATAKGGASYDRIDGLLGELRRLSGEHTDEPAVREQLASALFNAFTNSEVGGERTEGLLGELRGLSGEHPDEPAVRERLAMALMNAMAKGGASYDRIDGLLGELRRLSGEHPEEPSVREPLAKALFNAFNESEEGSERANRLLGELRLLSGEHPDEPAVREPLAKALFNAFKNNEAGGERAEGLLVELRGLSGEHPDEPAVREWLAKALYNAFYDSEAGGMRAEGLLWELRRLSGEHPDDPAVREPLAKALTNATANGGASYDWIDGLLEELRRLSGEHPDELAVREWLAMALFNAFNNSEAGGERAEGLLVELRRLSVEHPDEPTVREWLAKALFNSFCKSETGGERAEMLLEELRRLSGEHPDEPAVREPLANALYNAFNDSEAGGERAEGLLVELRRLSGEHPDEPTVRERLAKALLKVLINNLSDEDKIASLVKELNEIKIGLPLDSPIINVLHELPWN